MTTRWPIFLKLYTALLVLGLGGWFTAYHLIDPYGTRVFGLEMPRVPLNGNQRFFTPLLARDPQFDSVVIGDSTTLELRPDLLNETFGGHFVNLSLNGATPDENLTLLKVFRRFHANVHFALIRISDYDCMTTEPPKRGAPVFPDELYNQNPLDDVSVSLSWETARAMVQQIGVALGRHKTHAALDGHDDPFLDPKTHTPEGDRAKIEAMAEEMKRRAATAQRRASLDDFTFPGLHYLQSMLELLPTETPRLLVFLPRAPLALPAPDSPDAQRWAACKQRVAQMVANTPHTLIADMQYDSPLARTEGMFHDYNHYYQPLADDIVQTLGLAWKTQADVPHGVRVVTP